ncbi:hypothetical protein SESBI_50089 [Sesbania bispinosa]|nr:hypothetical protein SESBI_50089 [Sesbania bispinosa]
MGRKAVKRKGKEKVGECSFENGNAFDLEGAFKAITDVNDKLTRIKEKELTTKEIDILIKDTTGMSDTQLAMHEW